MRVITVQHKDVYKGLRKDGISRATEEYVSENLVKPYRFMQTYFRWESTPIFLGVVGHNVNYGGAKFDENSIAMEFEIPDEYVKIQRYYDWSDFIYFTELPWEFNDTCNVEKFGSVNEWALTIMNIKHDIARAARFRDPLQASVEMLNIDWLVDTLENLDKFQQDYNDNGGVNVLESLSKYK